MRVIGKTGEIKMGDGRRVRERERLGLGETSEREMGGGDEKERRTWKGDG